MAQVRTVEINVSTKQAQENIDELNKSLDASKDYIIGLEKELADLEKQLDKTPKKQLAAQKDLKDKIDKTKKAIKEENLAVKEIKNERDKYNNVIKESTKNQADFSASTNLLDRATGGLASKFKSSIGALKGVTNGFKTLRGAIISTGIGALVIAVTSLIAAFRSSEEGQNKWAKILGVVGVVTNNLVDIVSDLGEKLISVFENPKKALQDFWKLLKENIVNRFEGLLELIPQLGKAIGLLFKGQFAEAGKVALNATAKVTLGVENITDKIGDAIDATKEFIAEQQKEFKIAQEIADKRAKADKQERELLVERAKANRDVAALREQAADKENKSAEERIEALIKAGKIEQNITNKEIENARLRYEAKAAENQLSKSTKEDLTEEAQLLATLTDLETARLRKQKALTAELTTARREANAELEAERKAFLDLNQQIDDAIAISQEQKRELELTKIREHYTKLILSAKEQGLKIEELRDAQREALKKKEEEWNKEDLEAKKASAEKEVKIEQDKFNAQREILNNYIELSKELFSNIENLSKARYERELLSLSRERSEIENNAALSESTKIKALENVEKKEKEVELRRIKAERDQFTLKQSLILLEQILKAKSYAMEQIQIAKLNVAKGVATAQEIALAGAAAVGKAQMSLGAFVQAMGPFGIGAFALSIGGILASINSARKTANAQISSLGATAIQSGNASSGPVPQISQQIPQFTTVGTSGVNQLAETISGGSSQSNQALDKIVETLKSNNDKPIKAYVVSKDITTAQELDRNKVLSASL